MDRVEILLYCSFLIVFSVMTSSVNMLPTYFLPMIMSIEGLYIYVQLEMRISLLAHFTFLHTKCWNSYCTLSLETSKEHIDLLRQAKIFSRIDKSQKIKLFMHTICPSCIFTCMLQEPSCTIVEIPSIF